MNKARYFIIILLTIVILPGVQGYAQTSGTTPKGHLVIIGGGTRTTEVMQRFVDLAGGPKSEFLVISTAGLEEERGSGMVKELNALGVRKAASTDASAGAMSETRNSETSSGTEETTEHIKAW